MENLQENKQIEENQNENNIMKSKKKGKKGIRNVLICVIALLLIILAGLSFLYFKTFSIQYKPMTISAFWTENNLKNKFIANGKKIDFDIPDDVMSTELTLLLKDLKLPNYFEIKGVKVEPQNERVDINSTVYNIPIPFSMALKTGIDGDNLKLELGDIIIGDNGLHLGEAASNKLISVLFKDQLPLIIDSKEALDVDIVKVSQLDVVNDRYHIQVVINDGLIKSELKEIAGSANEVILNLFKNSSDTNELQAYELVEGADSLGENEIESLINDILSNTKISEDILILADVNDDEKILNQYSKYFKNIKFEDLIDKKKALLTEALTPLCSQLISGLTDTFFSEEPMYINKGQPYRLSDHKMISVSDVSDSENLKIPYASLNKMSFCYDKKNDVLLISYKLSDNLYLILHNGEAITMTGDSYKENFKYDDNGDAGFVQDSVTWDAIVNKLNEFFQTDKVFIRYMKADEKDAFVIASPSYNFQNLWVFAFEKNNEEWSIIEENIDSLENFNQKHPEFNFDTVTDEIQTVKMHNLGEDMFQVILEDMVNKGIISSTNNYSINYCSYGNQYIDFQLSNGKEYVYLVYSMYLKAVYDKETAENTLEDLPSIITLQDSPDINSND